MSIRVEIEKKIRDWQMQDSKPVCAYLYDLSGIRAQVAQMIAVMPQQTHLFYAIKANPDKRIIETLLPLVAGFEVASIGELMLVREVSKQVPILFGGPGKKDDEIKVAIEENVTFFHVESLLELRKIILYANQGQTHVQILLRINLRSDSLPKTHITMGGRATPFGLDESLISEAVAILSDSGNQYVHFSGFHLHSLSNNLSAELHAEMVGLYLQKVGDWREAYHLDVKVVNAGGGFGVSYKEDTPNFDWAHFTSLLQENGVLNYLQGARLFFEPGRLIVADHGYYIVEVVDIKPSHDQYFAVIRGGTHHNRLPASWGHNHPFYVVDNPEWNYPFQRPAVREVKVSIVGELCTPKDRLHTDAELESLGVGDVLVFEKSGAYCWTISHHDFLGHPHPKFHYILEDNL